ncbi:MAG: ABC transporter substrate-binding protein [Candidatus Bathyarchaeota archaeon]|nr:ABC transporter substrate-binding protein [Candidatus Bathyarchaeota archaeon]MDH5745340.1 ABC transporter substrate-binding protein [Candidatus Bathyarchaeota archaeon]
MKCWIVAILALVLLLMPIVGVTAQEEPTYGGTLTWVITSEPDDLAMFRTLEATQNLLVCNFFNSFFTYTAEGNYVPDLLESYEISKDGLTYTFHFPKDVKFHDGEPFTSEDVKFSIENIYFPYSPGFDTIFKDVAVETPDDLTLILKLKEPRNALMDKLRGRYILFYPKHLYEGTDILKNPYNNNPIGTGPFKFKEWVRGSHIEAVKNENYFKKGLPYLDGFLCKFVYDEMSVILGVEKGEIDYMPREFPFAYWKQYSLDPQFKVEPVSYISVSAPTLWLNHRREPFSNAKVRHAINLAMDKDDISEKVYYGLMKPVNGWIPQGWKSPFLQYNPKVPEWHRDVERANELLDEAGYPRGTNGVRFSADLYIYSERPQLDMAELLRTHLSEVGIEVTVKPLLEPAFEKHIYMTDFDFDMAVEQSETVGSTPQDTLFIPFSTKTIGTGPITNCAGYNNTRLNELFDIAPIEMDMEKLQEILFEMQEILYNDMPAIPIVGWWTLVSIAQSDVMNVPHSISWRETLENVWIKAGAPSILEEVEDMIKLTTEKVTRNETLIYGVIAVQLITLVLVAAVLLRRRPT